MADNVRAPIRLSDIDNLLEDSIFETTNGAKLVEYMKTKRTGGRMRLQNIFEQVAAQVRRPRFNLRGDTSDPQPLPDSPNEQEALNDDAEAGPSSPPEEIPATNPDAIEAIVAEPVVPTASASSSAQNDIPVTSSQVSRKPTTRSPAVSLAREVMINQYHRTNAAKCNFLKQLATSTPKVDTSETLNRISTFTTSISPIVENIDSPAIESQPVVECFPAVPANALVPNGAPDSQRCGSPIVHQLLAPCSQAVAGPESSTPQKVIVVRTNDPQVEVQLAPELENIRPPSPDVIIPETPSPAKIPDESPRVPHAPLQPRRLTATFTEMENGFQNDADVSDVMTSDESAPIIAIEVLQENDDDEEEELVTPALNVSLPKSILKDADVSLRKRNSFRVSFSQQLVEQREISPAPSIPEAHYSSCSDDSNESDIDEDEFEVVDEVYSDDSADYGAGVDEEYEEVEPVRADINKSYVAISERPGSPLLNVVDEEPGQWFGSTTPRVDNEKGQLSPTTANKKYDKTNLQLVDIITDWDDEDDDDDDNHGKDGDEQESAEKSIDEIPETQQPANTTKLDAMELTASDLEQSAVRLIDLPSPPKQADVPMEQDEETDTPLSPPPQFTDSAKKRFAAANDEAVLNRLHSELASSEASPQSSGNELKDGSYEKIPETLVEIAQSFRDAPPTSANNAAPFADPNRCVAIQAKTKRSRKKKTVDPAKESYFNTMQETFARPASPAEPALTTTTKRKLYAAKPTENETPKSKPSNADGHILLDLRVVLEKLQLPVEENEANLEIKNEEVSAEEIILAVEPDKNTETEPSTDIDKPESVETDNAKEENSKPNRMNGVTKKTRYKAKKADTEEKEQLIEQTEQPAAKPEEKRPRKASKRTQPQAPATEALTTEPEPVKSSNVVSTDVAEPSSPARKTSPRSRKHKKTSNEPDLPEKGTDKQQHNLANTASSTIALKPSKATKPKTKTVELNVTPEPATEELGSPEVQSANQSLPETTVSTVCSEASNTEKVSEASITTAPPEAASSNGPSEEVKEPESATPMTVVHCNLNDVGDRVRTSEDEEFAGFETVPVQLPEKKRHINRKKGARNLQKEEPAASLVAGTENIPQPADQEVHAATKSRKQRYRSKPNNKPQSQPPPVELSKPEEEVDSLPLKKRKVRENSNDSSDENATIETTSDTPQLRVTLSPIVFEGELPQTVTESSKDVESPPQDIEPPKSKTLSMHRRDKTNTVNENKETNDSETPPQDIESSKSKTHSKRHRDKARTDHENEKTNDTEAPPQNIESSQPKTLSRHHRAKTNTGNENKKTNDSEAPLQDTESSKSKTLGRHRRDKAKTNHQNKETNNQGEPPQNIESPKSKPISRHRRDKAQTDHENKESNDQETSLQDVESSKSKTFSRHRRDNTSNIVFENELKVVLQKLPEKRLPRYLRDYDDALDKTWKPNQTKLLKEKTNSLRRHLDKQGNNSESSETEQPARRSKRNCRIASLILLTNPFIKSASQKPNYLPMSLEEMLEAEHLAKEIVQKQKRRYKKRPRNEAPKETDSDAIETESRKRAQDQPPEDQLHTKKSRLQTNPDGTATDTDTNLASSSGSEAHSTHSTHSFGEICHEKHEWLAKLMHGTHREESLPAGPGTGETIHFKLNDLSFQERNGIQYSFFAYSERENCGFLRFAPAAYKKKTLTTNFQLKFLMLSGQLHFHIDGKDALAKAGEFVIIPEDSKYSIKNGEEISLVFMIKVISIAGQLSIDTMQTTPPMESTEDYMLEK
ncbi:titin-like isoform X2 [Wyeomyia smithii]|uniref:titin-like isoform X2 n=1 Tax=Wyeomyia smithii TaxID=174621 RepID=UPI002467BBCC|nr:titin-like isoform X2 [Wyeomyia smithii]